MPLKNPTAGITLKLVGWVGDSTVNRAIPHGLGKTPSLVIILDNEPANNNGYLWLIVQGRPRVNYSIGGASSSLSVTAMDSTNFYVGNATSFFNSANLVTNDHIAVVLG